MRLFISAGEASGDAYGAAIVETLMAVAPEEVPKGGNLLAMGGVKLRAIGATIVADSSRWGAIGIVESLLVGYRVLAGAAKVFKALRTGDPGVFVPIDFGAANIRFARYAKKKGWKVLYFIPPGSWRRHKQGKDLPHITDAIVTPFSWSADILNGMGANAHWFGHPIKWLAKKQHATLEGEERAGVAILPGSRAHEIQHNLPVIAGALRGLPSVEFAVAATVNLEELRTRWEALSGRKTDRFTPEDVFGVLSRARAAIVCSGTATLQGAVARCPMVVIYRLSKVTEIEGRLLGMKKKLKFISLPNIILDRSAVPELIQYDADSPNIRRHLERLLTEPGAREAQLHAFEELDTLMGPDDCIDKTAELIRDMIAGSVKRQA